MGRLILLRHGRPAGAEGLCYGRTDLAPGADLEPLARRLAAELPAIDRIVTSPLRRARALAEALAHGRRLPLAVDPRLCEMDFGTWEGRPWEAIARAELDAWAADLLGARPHAGESVAMLVERVAAALAEWAALPGSVLLVVHMGTIRAALAWAGRPDPWSTSLPFGGWLTLEAGDPADPPGDARAPAAQVARPTARGERPSRPRRA